MSFLKKRKRRAGNCELRVHRDVVASSQRGKKKMGVGGKCRIVRASAASLVTSPTFTLGCWPICEHAEPTVCLRVVQLIQTGICFPFIQKDSLGQIGKQQLSFGADQHNSEAITWNRSLSAPEIIFRLNLELGIEIGRCSFV